MTRTVPTASGVLPRRRPGLIAFGAIACGVWLSQSVEGANEHAALLAGLCAACALVGGALRGRAGWAAVIGAAALLGLLIGGVRTGEYPSDSVAHAMPEERSLLRVEGVLLEDPRLEPQQRGELARFVRDAPATRAPLRVRRVERAGEMTRASGVLWLRIDGVAPDLRAGDALRATGHATRVEGPRNPGERDFRPLARQRNLAGRLLVPTPGLVERVEDAGASRAARIASGALRARADLRASASSWLDRLEVDARSRAMLAAALLGEREGAYREVQDSFARVGLAHLLAISGLHLGLFAWFALLLVRALGLPRAAQGLVVAAGVVVYLVIVPANPPIVRAAAMTLAFLGAESVGRRYDRLNLLAWTACAILVARPMDLFSPGFQLSFLAVGALIVLASPVRDAMLRAAGMYREDPDERGAAHHVARCVASALAAGVTAWAVTSPLVMLHVGLFSPLGAPLSALAVPLFAMILGVGYLAMFLGAAYPSVASALAPALGVMAEWFLAAARRAETLPLASVVTPPTALWWAALATLCAWRALRRGVRDWAACAALALLCLYPVALARRAPTPGVGVELRIDTLAVGDGSCHLLRDATGAAVLWDCGSTWVGIGERSIPDALRALGAWRLDAIVVSHPNLDHYSGLLDTVRRVRPSVVLVGESFVAESLRDPHGPVAFVLERLGAAGVEVRTLAAGESFGVGSLRAEALWPPSGHTSERANDDSLVVRIRVETDGGERIAMLFGDLEPAGMRGLRALHPGLRAEVIEAPHHGSARPESIAFVRALEPRVVLQSTGPSRLGDERWDGVKAGREWWITARDGAIETLVMRDGRIVSGPAARPPARSRR